MAVWGWQVTTCIWNGAPFRRFFRTRRAAEKFAKRHGLVAERAE